MSFLGNLIWLIFGGLITSLAYVLGGIILCVTIVGIPFGLQSINMGVAVLAPFGKEVVASSHQSSLKILFDVIWILVFGWEIAIAHLTSAAILAITIVGLPFAKQHLKLIPVALFPFNQHLE
ncbi:MAG: YccF domain-containing protein [Chloroflexi bacterium]|nr:YccF domain-containing protein [Chloroflexota bacterium]